MWKDFRDFAFKGNVLELAIGVIIGGAFGKIVTALVNDIIMPLVSLILPSGSWQTVAITLAERAPDGPEGDVRLLVGDLASDVVDFLIVGWVLFLVVRGLAKLRRGGPQEPATKTCAFCLEKVAYHARRCKFCTSELTSAASSPPPSTPPIGA